MIIPIPEQIRGKKSDATSEEILSSLGEANSRYSKVLSRLFNVNQWSEYISQKGANFSLYDASGNKTEEPPRIGNFICIDIPGPNNSAGEGFDWVEITKIEHIEETEYKAFILEIKPSRCPLNDDESIAHFYNDCASNSIILKQLLNAVSLGVHGRNEEANSERVPLLDKARNYVVAKGGTFGLSRTQWEVFSEDVLRNNIE